MVRLAPIKDVKTMIYAFFELHERLPKVRLHIMGGVDDEEYGAECHALVDTLGVRDPDLYRSRQRGRVHGKARLYHFDEHLRGASRLACWSRLQRVVPA